MSTADHSGKTLKKIAIAMGIILQLAGFLILKSDPIRVEGRGRDQAVQQVKKFASFIKTRPELARPVERSVVSMARARLNEPVSNVSAQTGAVQSGTVQLSTDPFDLYQKLNQALSVREIKRDETWDEKIELLINMASSNDVNADLKAKVLDLLADQLIQARIDRDDVVRYHTDDWFEKYLRLEARPSTKQQMITIYNEKIIQAINQTPHPLNP